MTTTHCQVRSVKIAPVPVVVHDVGEVVVGGDEEHQEHQQERKVGARVQLHDTMVTMVLSRLARVAQSQGGEHRGWVGRAAEREGHVAWAQRGPAPHQDLVLRPRPRSRHTCTRRWNTRPTFTSSRRVMAQE